MRIGMNLLSSHTAEIQLTSHEICLLVSTVNTWGYLKLLKYESYFFKIQPHFHVHKILFVSRKKSTNYLHNLKEEGLNKKETKPNLCKKFSILIFYKLYFIRLMTLNHVKLGRAVTFRKYLASVVSLIFLQKTLICNRITFRLLNLPGIWKGE